MNSIKLKAPLSDKNEVARLCEAGADEFFCGIEPQTWRRKYKDFSISQRFGHANFNNFRDLETAVKLAHRYSAKVHVAVNAFFYLEEQHQEAFKIIKDVLSIGADGIIFADLGLLQDLDKNLLDGKDIVIGTDAVIFNSLAASFYKRFSATRIVLPREMTLNEMKEVIDKDRSIEYEVFIIHDLCFFIDGFCAYCKEASGTNDKEEWRKKNIYLFSSSRIWKRGFGGGCRSNFRRQLFAVKSNKRIGRVTNYSFLDNRRFDGCGACAIYDFKKMGITSLKVLDRNLPLEEKIQATCFIKKTLEILDQGKVTKEEFIERCRALFKKIFEKKCNLSDCYYPSTFIAYD